MNDALRIDPQPKGLGGPRTPAGKAISSQNALKHGLASRRIIIEGEDPAEYQSALDGYLQDLNPEGQIETALAHEIANAQWFKARSLRFQAEAFNTYTPDGQHVLPPDLPVLIRYQTASERAFYRALNTLQALQKARKSAPRQFVSQKPAPRPEESTEEASFQETLDYMESFAVRMGLRNRPIPDEILTRTAR
jgi:hypothetical protein